MRNLLALIGLVVVGFGGIGWYLGWYHLSVAKRPEGTVEIKVDVDSKKVAEDAAQKLNQAAAAVGDQLNKDQPAPTSGSLTPPAPTPAPASDGGWLMGLFPAQTQNQAAGQK
jgi:hypothetical protein